MLAAASLVLQLILSTYLCKSHFKLAFVFFGLRPSFHTWNREYREEVLDKWWWWWWLLLFMARDVILKGINWWHPYPFWYPYPFADGQVRSRGQSEWKQWGRWMRKGQLKAMCFRFESSHFFGRHKQTEEEFQIFYHCNRKCCLANFTVSYG